MRFTYKLHIILQKIKILKKDIFYTKISNNSTIFFKKEQMYDRK